MNAASAQLDARAPVMSLLASFGPGSGVRVEPEDAMAYCRTLARSHYENFSVLTSIVPRNLRDSFAAVYAFCRWSDDLADETGTGEDARARSTELLAWWRRELEACFAGEPGHPVFVALSSVRTEHDLAAEPFHHLIDAFEQDQRVTRYQSWDELLGYCRGSANPVGRLVLALGGLGDGQTPPPGGEHLYAKSDATCTALQMINFWQDIRRDLLERDRVYLPSETGVTAEDLRSWMDDWTAQHQDRVNEAVGPLLVRTRELFEQGAALPAELRTLAPGIAPAVELFGAGGLSLQHEVEWAAGATLWYRPTVSKMTKARLLLKAWLGLRLGLQLDLQLGGAR